MNASPKARSEIAGGHGSGLAAARRPSQSREGKPTLLWDFKPPGPVAGAFIKDLRSTTMLVGPFGSGKTIASIYKQLALARRQPKSIIDGVRKCKVYNIGKNYKAVWDKIVETHAEVWPRIKGLTEFKGGRGEDAVYKIGLNDPVYGKMEIVNQFVAVENIDVEDWSKGLKGTGYYLFEMDTLPEEVYEACLGRRWRYADSEWPDEYKEEGAELPPSCVWGDLNAPKHGNWLYKKYWGVDNPEMKMYIQPSGMAPNAENIQNKGRQYYINLIEGFEKAGHTWKIDRFVHVKPGFDRSGKPVFTEFQSHLHRLAVDMPGDGALPLVIGVDQGSTPAAVFMQIWPSGVIHILDFVACPNGETWSYQDLADRVNEKIRARYSNYAIVLAPDPQAFAIEPGREDKQPWALSLAGALNGVGLVKPYSNLIDDRLKHTRSKLRLLAHDGKPMLRINPSCVDIIDAFQTDYRMKAIKTKTGDRYIPDKSAYCNHVMDACVYGVMVCAHQPSEIHAAMASILSSINYGGQSQVSSGLGVMTAGGRVIS